jgi:hypothetical protein
VLPLNLLNIPLQTQVQRVYRASTLTVFLHFIDHVLPATIDPKASFRARVNGTAVAPFRVDRIEGNQYRLFFFLSPTDVVDHLYFYGGYPPIPFFQPTAAPFLLPNYWPVDWFRFLYPQPLQLGFLGHLGLQVFVNLDRDITSGSTNPSDWLLRTTGPNRVPFSVSFTGLQVTLLVLGIPAGNLRGVEYIKGSTPFVAEDRGQMQSWSFDFPFPTTV